MNYNYDRFIFNYNELFNFNNLNAAGFVSLVAQIASYLDGVRNSEVISSRWAQVNGSSSSLAA